MQVFFFAETLKQCNKKRNEYIHFKFNIICVIAFFSFLGMFLLFKYKTKLSPKEKADKERAQQEYILNKLKTIHVANQREQNYYVTNLPTFESDYDLLRRKYY